MSFLYTMTGHIYAPRTVFYAICLHSLGPVPLLFLSSFCGVTGRIILPWIMIL